METIIIENVSKSYGKTMAVDGLSLRVKEGEIYGFIGPNGAGKSTTIRMLLNFIKADYGNIKVLGFSPTKHGVEIKKNTGYVSADTFIYSDMKVKELFRFTESFHKIDASKKTKQLTEILEIDIHKKFEQLSFGNRKKVAIACALLHSPKLIILDEPSNGLDPVIRSNMYELLKEEQKNGATIFFSSHVLSEVQHFCTRIGLLKEGKLIKETSAADFTNVGYLQVRIESKEAIDFSSLQGIAGLTLQDNVYHFIFSGNPNDLIKKLSTANIDSLHISEPELENVFMHYFEKESEVNHAV
ncbi:MAG: ABC transporter ATP-binding protein [Bacteroidota bacterium]